MSTTHHKIQKFPSITCALFTIAMSQVGPLGARDYLFAKSRSVIEGKIIRQGEQVVVFEGKDGSKLYEIPKAEVRGLVSTESDLIIRKSGEVFEGTVISENSEGVTFKAKGDGKLYSVWKPEILYVLKKPNNPEEELEKWELKKRDNAEAKVDAPLPTKVQTTIIKSPPGTGKLITGLSVFGGVYVATAIIGAATGAAYSAIPFVGPILQVSHNTTRRYDTANYASAVLQIGGMAWATIGYYQRKRFYRELNRENNRVSLLPWIDTSGTGLVLSARW